MPQTARGHAIFLPMMLTRTPGPVLRPFVKTLWATDRSFSPRPVAAARERVLPAGTMHLAFGLSDSPFRLFEDGPDSAGHAVGHAIVGGARCAPYVRDISGPVRSVGAELQPGASELFFGVPAIELAGRHTPLDALWGRSAQATRERLVESDSAEEQLNSLESILADRLPRIHGLHPAVAYALGRFTTTADIREVVRQSGYSHRRFIALFRQAVGMTPKRYCRVLRFRRVLRRLAASPAVSGVELANDSGYTDQSHFNREFREFAGITPGEYRGISPSLPHHVPICR